MKKFGILTLLTVILMSFTNTSGYQPGDKATDFKLK